LPQRLRQRLSIGNINTPLPSLLPQVVLDVLNYTDDLNVDGHLRLWKPKALGDGILFREGLAQGISIREEPAGHGLADDGNSGRFIRVGSGEVAPLQQVDAHGFKEARTDHIEIGPYAGSCGAAAYLGQPVYSPDIATDPVWGTYRDLALRHKIDMPITESVYQVCYRHLPPTQMIGYLMNRPHTPE